MFDVQAIGRGVAAIYYRETLILKRRLPKMLASMSVSPLLYLVAFGAAMSGASHDGRPYLDFLLPGLAAMTCMNQAWSIAGEINISRFYWHIFEEFQAAPITAFEYVLGETLAGVTRAFLAVGVIVLLGLAFGVRMQVGGLFWLAMFLNAFAFSALAVALAMLIKSHADQALMTNFVITPMAFLGGTFFPVEKLPVWAKPLVALLPLTHAASAARAAAWGLPVAASDLLILAGAGAAFFLLGLRTVRQAQD